MRRTPSGPDPTGFAKAIAAFQAEADAFAATAQTGDMAQIGKGMQSLGKTCGGCHDNFRKPKEESYMRDGGHH